VGDKNKRKINKTQKKSLKDLSKKLTPQIHLINHGLDHTVLLKEIHADDQNYLAPDLIAHSRSPIDIGFLISQFSRVARGRNPGKMSSH